MPKRFSPSAVAISHSPGLPRLQHERALNHTHLRERIHDQMTAIALVTGATKGIGLATVKSLARTRHKVILSGRDGQHAEDRAAELRSDGLDVESLQLDVTDAKSVTAAAAAVRDRYGRLDALINNAGILPEAADPDDHEFASIGAFEETFRTNTFGPLRVIETFLPLLKLSPRGRIVNVSTTMGSLSDQADPDSPFYGMVVPGYQASKAALNSITIGLSKTLADTPIKVTSVCPGFVQTDLTPMNRDNAPLTPTDAAHVIARAATLGDEQASGQFLASTGTVSW